MAETKHEAIWAAAEELLAQGNEKPTNEEVHQHMGGGSLTHISPAMREWREKRASSRNAQIDLPPALHKEGERLVLSVWNTAIRLAKQQHEANENEYLDKIEQSDAERTEALAEIERLEAELININELLESKNQESVSLTESMSKLKEQHNELKIENASLAASTQAKEELLLATKSELADAKENIEHLQDKLAVLADQRP